MECPPMCPSCGYDFHKNKPIVLGHWEISARTDIYYKGERIPFSSTHRCILHTIAKTYPRGATLDVLVNRCCDSEDRTVVSVHLYQMRRKCQKLGIPYPLIHPGKGRKLLALYRWDPKEAGTQQLEK